MSKPVKVGIAFVIIYITLMILFAYSGDKQGFVIMLFFAMYPFSFLPEIVGDFISNYDLIPLIAPIAICYLFLVGYLLAKIYYFIKEKYNKI